MTQSIKTYAFGTLAVALLSILALFSMPSLTHAAQYAYIDTLGQLKSVTATDWMTAIAIAPNIHMHSGVYLLDDSDEFDDMRDAN